MYKVIIAEDEAGARNFLAKFIEENIDGYEVAGCFANGAQALEYLRKNKADVCITDIRMPITDGLTLAKELHDNYPDIQIIIISGYGEFEYAKKAIEYNVKQYILKPIDFDDFARILIKLRSDLDKRKPQPASELIFAERERFFTDIMMGALTTDEEIEYNFKKLGFNFELKDAKAAVYRVEFSRYYEVLENWQYGRESFERALQNLMNFDTGKAHVYSITRRHNNFIVIIVYKEYRNRFTEEMKEVFKNFMELDVRIEPLSDVVGLYELAKLNISEFFGNDEMRLVMSHLMINDIKGAENILKKIIETENKKEIGTVDDYLMNIEGDDNVINKAKKYIEANYHKDITRDDVANYVFFNPVYFGRYFKNKVGMTINDYILSIRMDKAVELLATDMRIADIGERLGYQSTRNFQRIFKLYTGVTATEYRRRFLNAEEHNNENN